MQQEPPVAQQRGHPQGPAGGPQKSSFRCSEMLAVTGIGAAPADLPAREGRGVWGRSPASCPYEEMAELQHR